MIITNYPAGDTAGCIDYVLSDKDWKNESRGHKPEILDGSPDLTKIAGLSSASFSNQATSTVISFAKDENPTDEQLQEIIKSFKETFFDTMADRVASVFVLHNDKTKHIHIVTANVDLETGKYYNPMPPGKMTIDLLRSWQDLTNYRYGFEQVEEKPKTHKPFKEEFKAKSNKDAGEYFKSVLANSKNKDIFANACLDLIKSGEVKNRSELIDFLKDNGYTFSRIGKDYFSIVNQEGKNLRLKDGIFSDSADYKSFLVKRDKPAFDPQQAEKQLARIVASRSAFNEKRYQAKPTAQAKLATNPRTSQNALHAPRVSGSTLPPTHPNTEAQSAPAHVPEQTSTGQVQPKDREGSGSQSSGDSPTPSSAPSLDGIASANAQLSRAIAQLNNAKTPRERYIASFAIEQAKDALRKAQSAFHKQQKKIPPMKI